MSEPESTTVMLQGLLDGLATGDPTARDALFNLAAERLMTIARKLLRSFGGEARVGMWTAEVLNEAYPRVAQALDDVKPTSPVMFFGLVRLQMKRVLLDRVRVIDGVGENRKPEVTSFSQLPSQGDGNSPAFEPIGADDERLRALMIDLVDAIESLPEKQAETAWLKLTGYTHREIAGFLGVHHDTVDTYWSQAIVRLSKFLAPFMGTR